MKNSLNLLSFAVVFVTLVCMERTVYGQDEFAPESLPEPVAGPKAPVTRRPLVNTSSMDEYLKGRVEFEAASRAMKIERARQISEARTNLLIAQMYSGYQPARPTVNAGYMFSAPPIVRYRWSNMYQPFYAW